MSSTPVSSSSTSNAPHRSESATPRPTPARTTTSPGLEETDAMRATRILSNPSNDAQIRAAVAHSPSLAFSIEMIIASRDQRNHLKKMLKNQNSILDNLTNDIVSKGFLNDYTRKEQRRTRLRAHTPSIVFPNPTPENIVPPGKRTNPIDVDSVPSLHTRAGREDPSHPNVARYGQRVMATTGSGNYRCFQCNRVGHYASVCGQFQCMHCRKHGPGHYPSRCPHRPRPQSSPERIRPFSPVYEGDDGYDDAAIGNITGEPCGDY